MRRAADNGLIDRDPDAVLVRLKEGNQRFMNGKSTRQGRTPADFAADDQGQAPLAIIVGCADSRVAPELVFDQGVGELFVVRVAGNVVMRVGPIVKGSIEFAVAELLERAVDHGSGAQQVRRGRRRHQTHRIERCAPWLDRWAGRAGQTGRCGRQGARGGQARCRDSRANVKRCVARLKGLDPIVSPAVDQGKVKVVGGVYELSTGAVDVFV